MSLYIYLAGPFFKPREVETIMEVERKLMEQKINFYSPRDEGVLIHQNEEEKQRNKRRIYDKNIEMIKGSHKVLAIIDDRDIGTIWEMGYAIGKGIPVVTYSNNSYGLNVMIAECVQAHTIKLDDAIRALRDDSFTGEIIKGVY